MCGITGYWNFKAEESEEEMCTSIVRMTNTMYLRGPDSGGAWLDLSAGLALGHRRLAIVDLSPTGHQPMVSADGRYVICYNGEIYNAAALRKRLIAKGIHFAGNSDTEVILYSCALFGVEETIKSLIGMFAFAFWDKAERKLTLVRDRLGIKPLYWGQFGSLFIFGSELKAIVAHGAFKRQINRDAIAGLMDNCYIPGPTSIYEGVFKLQPGHLLEIDSGGCAQCKCWWNPLEILLNGFSNPTQETEEEMINHLDSLLHEAIKSRMVADVPIGAFLSGGIDSSLIASIMQAESSTPINTFSIGFDDAEYNEAPYAKAVASYLGTKHTEEYMTYKEAIDIIPQIPEYYDEPFADSSQLPTYLLSRMTRQHVTVVLSGDGGDELFGGYARYFDFNKKFNKLDRPFWQSQLINFLGSNFSERTLDCFARLLPNSRRPHDFGHRIRTKARQFKLSPKEFYRQCVFFHWPNPESMVIGSSLPDRAYEDVVDAQIYDPLALIQFLDSVNYLPDDILVKVDRASMAASLEARVPLIDHRVYEYTWTLPRSMHIRNNQGKYILRKVLDKYIPRELVDRPKMGFGVPIDDWLRGPLREWAEYLLNSTRLKNEGWFAPETILPIWERQLAGDNYQYWLWEVLMFQAWSDYWSKPVPGKEYDNFPIEIQFAEKQKRL